MSFLPLINSPALSGDSVESLCRNSSVEEILLACQELDTFRQTATNLYKRARALFFLRAIHRFYLPPKLAFGEGCPHVPYEGFRFLIERKFEEAIGVFLEHQGREGASDALSSALAQAYERLAFQTLSNQVRSSVQNVWGNQWMFRMGSAADQPIKFRKEILDTSIEPHVLQEQTPARMDLTHSGWSDIFFLGMDYPQGARVLNISIDVAPQGEEITPPVSAYLRTIERPVIRLVSVDLGDSIEITEISEIFDLGKDHLGLLKVALIASGIVPFGLDGTSQSLADLLEQMLGKGRGIELTSRVCDIPKGMRLAISTNLLVSLVTLCMRATGQVRALTGALTEEDRRLVLARSLFGEWLSSSGGGWQDPAGIWPGIKLIEGKSATVRDVEFGTTRGCLMPRHKVLPLDKIDEDTRNLLEKSLVIAHGGMTPNVGPILEMVTEKYLLRNTKEWEARQEALSLLDQALQALEMGDIRELGKILTKNFEGPMQTIIPWASNAYTEKIIAECRKKMGEDFWGFWMLGGVSGGGMGFILNPQRKQARQELLEIMCAAQDELRHALPFTMRPALFDFRINETGTTAQWMYPENVPAISEKKQVSSTETAIETPETSLTSLLEKNGFDRPSHEKIRSDLLEGKIGLAKNKFSADTQIENVREGDYCNLETLDADKCQKYIECGQAALDSGEVGVVTLAAGVASRWTQGAGVVKSLNPFAKLGGKHRSFIETHLAKSRQTATRAGIAPPHIFTTSDMTYDALETTLAEYANYGYPGDVRLSTGCSIGLRLVPTVRDLRYTYEATAQQRLGEQAQKLRDSRRAATIAWAQKAGEASDYTDNLPRQCLHPLGHWYEIPNMLLNGTLLDMLRRRPQLKTLMLHNIDTLGANLDPLALGSHLSGGSTLSYEVISRRIEDRGGGLARVHGRPQLVEGLAMPNDTIEFDLSFYSTMTTWIDIDGLLEGFGLDRAALADIERVRQGVRTLAERMPTYVTLKEVKRRWGHGQEDIFPVAQFEKLWGDLSAIPEVSSAFLVVSRLRGQQLKDPAQLDGWLREGAADHLESLCQWSEE